MKIKNITRIVGLIALFIIVGSVSVTQANTLQPCGNLQPPAGNEVYFRVYAVGVQIYRWSGNSWDFVAPSADLFASPNYQGQVGIHYGGPTWQSNSGSKVMAARLRDCTPDSTAVPWLLLQVTSTTGPGVFSQTTFITRVNTVGGLRPTTPGSAVGLEARVPYRTEYYFFRAVK
jgi:hypothetical protein